jgi:hypothetical protein
MNPLIPLVLAGSAAAGIAFWQQASIDRIHSDMARLSNERSALRKRIETDRAALTEARSRIDGLSSERRNMRNEQAANAESALTPDQEGWWPADKPYFYLSKDYLRQVRFRNCLLPIAEANKLLTKRAKAANPNVVSVTYPAVSDQEGRFTYRLFEAGKLNPDISVLLGMNETEAATVSELYATLMRSVRSIEAARIQPVNPPEPASIPGQTVVARMPDISGEVNPQLAELNMEVKELLGEDRAVLLTKHAENYFANYGDKLGAVPREFIRQENSLFTTFREKWGTHQGRGTSSLPQNPNDEYGHLFGPGAPCELK